MKSCSAAHMTWCVKPGYQAMLTPRLAAVSSPRTRALRPGPTPRRTALAATMKGAASQTCTLDRSSSDPSSQNTISATAKGLGERLIASDVAAPARLPTANT